MPIPFLLQLVIGVGLSIVGYMLMPKPKQPKPDAMQEQEDPTAEAGKPIPVIFGSITVESANLIGFFDKEMIERTVKTGGKK